MKTSIHFWSYLTQFFLEWKIFQTKVVEKLEIHILCSIIPLPKNHAVYEVMWKNFVEWGWPQMTIWRMHFACWIPKPTNTHTICVILIVFPLQQWLREHTSILRYMCVACLVVFCTFSFLWHTVQRKQVWREMQIYIW